MHRIGNVREAATMLRASVLLIGASCLAGCASVSVTRESENASLAPKAPPSVLHVRNFKVPRGVEFDVAAPRDSGSPEDRVAGFVADGISSNAGKWVASPSKLSDGDALPSSGLLVDGKFTRVRQGSRALRLILGFGAGRSRMDTTVRVYNLEKSADDPWLIFKTSGGSNVEPGLVGAVVPGPLTLPTMAAMAGGVASTVVGRGMKGVSQDGRRTGKVIAAAVHDYLVKHGLVERKTRVKRGGKVSTPAGELVVPGPLQEPPDGAPRGAAS